MRKILILFLICTTGSAMAAEQQLPINTVITAGQLVVPNVDIQLRQITPHYYAIAIQNGELMATPDAELPYCLLTQVDLLLDRPDHNLLANEELVISGMQGLLDPFQTTSVAYLLNREGEPHMLLRCYGQITGARPTADEYRTAVGELLTVD